MFFVIDWIDWSWKWTQLNLVKEALEEAWKTVCVFDYPRYWMPHSYYVEKYLNWWYWSELSAKMWSLFYALDRFDESNDIKKAIKDYDFVISNRYVSANIIHQASKIKDDLEFKDFIKWITDLEYNICKIPMPDKTIFLSVAPEISKQLIKSKEKREYIKSWENMDIHEEDDNHLLNAYNRAHMASKELNWNIIDCVSEWKIKSREDIKNEILKIVLN